MKAYLMKVLVLDFERYSPEDYIYQIDCATDHCHVVPDPEVFEIGEWSDDHPLNQRGTNVEEWLRNNAKAE